MVNEFGPASALKGSGVSVCSLDVKRPRHQEGSWNVAQQFTAKPGAF